MKKSLFKSFLIVIAVAVLFAAAPIAVFASETQTTAHLTKVPDGYIGVYTIEDLYCVRNDLTANYILMNDIDLTDATAEGGDWNYGGRGWNPIGSDDKYSNLAFSGVFDGNGYSIIGMNILIESSAMDLGVSTFYGGLFSCVTGTIKNLSISAVINIYSYRTSFFGAIAGVNEGTIENCFSYTTANATFCTSGNKYIMTSSHYLGAIAGSNRATIRNCSASGNLAVDMKALSLSHGNNTVNGCIGGISGYNKQTIEKCCSTVTVDANLSASGKYSFSNSSLSGSSTTLASGTINNYIGGIAGKCDEVSTISDCFNCGNVDLTFTVDKDDPQYGLIYSYVSGIANFAQIARCYSIDDCAYETIMNRGVLEHFEYIISDNSVTKCYFPDTLSGRVSTGAVALTEAQMKLKSMYSGWDFDNVWTMEGREDYLYPELRDVPLFFPDEDPFHEHSYTSAITTPATHIAEGVETFTCICGDTYTQSIAKLADHTYTAVVTAPTCTEDGFTTYTCECGESYIADYVDAAHSYVDSVCSKCGTMEIIASGSCGANLTWTLDSMGTLTITGSGDMDVWYETSVPWNDYRENICKLVLDDRITSVGNFAFYNCVNLTGDLIIPDSVTNIGSYAFSGCSGLTGELKIPDGVTSIGSRAFRDCSGFTGELKLPAGLTVIESGIFSDCSGLTGELIIPDGVTSIGSYAFSDSSGLTGELKLPAGLTEIADGVFNGCSGLTGELKIPDGVTSIGSFAFNECSGLTGELIIPDNATSIGYRAFSDCSGLTGDLIIPDSVTSIGSYAFEDCSGFTGELKIPAGLMVIEFCVFSGCSGLTGDLIIPDSVTSIGSFAFSYCSGLTGDLIIPDGVTSIGSYAFCGCSGLTGELIIPDSVTSIDMFAFNACEFEHIAYAGTEEQWNAIEIGEHNYILTTAPYRHFDFNAETDISETITPGTCMTEGSKTVACSCGYTHSAENTGFGDHTYTSEITTPATHLAEGVETFTCICGDTYTKSVAKLADHTYTAVVTAPTCTEDGYTTYTCECADSYVADYTDATGHDYTSAITTPATHLAEGVATFTCICGDTYTKSVAKLADHTYTAVVTAPTCTEDGFTTYTCACGDSYVADYTDTTGHDYASAITTPATHLTEGVEIFTCECGDSYTQPIAKLAEHTYTAVVTAPTCTEDGFTTYTCACGDSYVADYTDMLLHDFADGTNCTHCGEERDPDCVHFCHSDVGILKIIWKILNFLYSLFGTNHYCDCGMAHY